MKSSAFYFISKWIDPWPLRLHEPFTMFSHYLDPPLGNDQQRRWVFSNTNYVTAKDASMVCLTRQQDSSVNTELTVMAEKSLEEKNSIIYQCNMVSCNDKSMADKARVIINEQLASHLLLTGTLTDDQKIEINRAIALNPSFEPTTTLSTSRKSTSTKISTSAARRLSARCLHLFFVALLLFRH